MLAHRDQGEVAQQSRQLIDHGFVVLDALPFDTIGKARKCVVEHVHLLKNTRPNASSGHVAGFHRYPELEPLHALVSSHAPALDILRVATGSERIRSIGLTDITVNRSQQWHVDLLRGKYQHYLNPEICWGPNGGGAYKVLLYLQPGATLRVIPGGHRKPVALDNDRNSEPANAADVVDVAVAAGGIVLMDIRLPHRGSTEEELRNEEFRRNPKILVSTVLAADDKPLAHAMERGNLERLLDWDAAHRQSPSPQLASPNETVAVTAGS